MWAAAMAGQRAESGAEAPGRWTLPLATLAILGVVTATTMVGPLLVDLSVAFEVPLSVVGLSTAAMSLPWALGAPLAGLLSDRVGRRPLIALALAGVGLCSLLTALADDFATLLALRFAAGLFGALGPASLLAALGDLFPARRRAMAMSWFNLGFSLAAVAGTPAVGVVGGVLLLLALGSELSSEHRGAVLGLFSLTNHGGFVVGSALGGLMIALGGFPGLGAAMAICGGLAALWALPLWRRR